MPKFASLAGQRGLLAAAVAAAAVFVVLLAQSLVSTISYTVSGALTGTLQTDYLAAVWSGIISSALVVETPLAIGVFLCLWIIAPIAAELRLAAVVARAGLATAVGGLLALLMAIIWNLNGAFSGVGSLFGNTFPALPYDRIWDAVVYGVQSGIGVFFLQVPLVVLVGVLLWLWLQRHIVAHTDSATLDGV